MVDINLLAVGFDPRPAREGAEEFRRQARRIEASSARVATSTGGVTEGFTLLRAAMAALPVAAALGLYARLGRASIDLSRTFITAASEAEEIGSKFEAVFGEEAPAAEREILRLNATLGRSVVRLKQYAASLQDTFVPLGFTREASRELSLTLTQLGIDVASFQNAAEPDVLRDFQSALVGNTETVRKYGVVLTAASTEQEALRLGLAETKNEISEQDKVLARLSQILQGTTDAQGDAERTADSFANTVRRLKDEVFDLETAFGVDLTESLLSAADEFGGLEDVITAIEIGFGTVAEAAEFTIDSLGDLIALTRELSPAFDELFEQRRSERLQRQIIGLADNAGEAAILISTAQQEAFRAARSLGLEDPAARQRLLQDQLRQIVALLMDTGEEAETAEEKIQRLAASLSGSDGGGEGRDGQQRALAFSEERDRLAAQLTLSLDEEREATERLTQQRREDLLALAEELRLGPDRIAQLAELHLRLTEQETAGRDAAEAAARFREEQKAINEFARENALLLQASDEAIRGFGNVAVTAATDFENLGQVASDSLTSIATGFIRAVAEALFFKAVVEPLLGGAGAPSGAAAALLGFGEKGAFVREGRWHGYQLGAAFSGLVERPIAFPIAGGAGIAGDRGLEVAFSSDDRAIAPLRRDPQTGRLGVEMVGSGGGEGRSGGRSVRQVFHIGSVQSDADAGRTARQITTRLRRSLRTSR